MSGKRCCLGALPGAEYESSTEGATMAGDITFEQALDRAKRMSEKYVEKGPYEFFPLDDIVDEVQRGLAKNLVNHGRLYCP
jgi:sugar phosphate isomerase/epimerase